MDSEQEQLKELAQPLINYLTKNKKNYSGGLAQQIVDYVTLSSEKLKDKQDERIYLYYLNDMHKTVGLLPIKGLL